MARSQLRDLGTFRNERSHGDKNFGLCHVFTGLFMYLVRKKPESVPTDFLKKWLNSNGLTQIQVMGPG